MCICVFVQQESHPPPLCRGRGWTATGAWRGWRWEAAGRRPGRRSRMMTQMIHRSFLRRQCRLAWLCVRLILEWGIITVRPKENQGRCVSSRRSSRAEGASFCRRSIKQQSMVPLEWLKGLLCSCSHRSEILARFLGPLLLLSLFCVLPWHLSSAAGHWGAEWWRRKRGTRLRRPLLARSV